MADDEKIEIVGVCINQPNIFISIIFGFLTYFLLSLFMPALLSEEQFMYLLNPLIFSTSIVFLAFSYLIVKKRFSKVVILTDKTLYLTDFNNIKNDFINSKIMLADIKESKYKSLLFIPHLFVKLKNEEKTEITHISNLKKINEYIRNFI